MRKLLLATVAALGASMAVASFADAQTADDTSGQAFPTPGTVTVRLNGRFRFYGGVIDQSSARSVTNPGAAAAPAGALSSANSNSAFTAGASSPSTNRNSNYDFQEYARLYPGFDGVAANGLKYGASLEIRQDRNIGAGGGAYGSVSGADTQRGGLYFRREFGYVGTDRFGTLRIGSTDSPNSLYLTGNFENFNDGGWNGDVPTLLPGALQLAWPLPDVGATYTTTKLVYLSPQFYGVDFGLSYEPSTGNVNANDGCGGLNPNGNTAISGGNSVAAPGCDNLASTSTTDIQRRKNTYEALIRYRGTLGPVGIAATASYVGSGRVQDAATPARGLKFEDLSVGDFGLTLTYAGLTVGGNFYYGRTNNTAVYNLVPKGQPNETAFVAGASYTYGPIVVGASYVDVISTGDIATATGRSVASGALTGGTIGGQRREQGIAAGGGYSVAPGLSIFLAYLYDKRKQNGFDFITGTSNAPTHNTVTGQALALETSFSW